MLKNIIVGIAAVVVISGSVFAYYVLKAVPAYHEKSQLALLRITLSQAYSVAEMYKAENGLYPKTGETIPNFPDDDEDGVTLLYSGDGHKFLIMAIRNNLKLSVDQDRIYRDENGEEINY